MVLARPLGTGRASSEARDRADRRLGGYLLLAVFSVLAVPALSWLDNVVNHDAAWVFDNIAGFFREQRALGSASWFLWTTVGALIALVAGAVRWRYASSLVIGARARWPCWGSTFRGASHHQLSLTAARTGGRCAAIARARAEPDGEQARRRSRTACGICC
jgi:hypothetical protein